MSALKSTLDVVESSEPARIEDSPGRELAAFEMIARVPHPDAADLLRTVGTGVVRVGWADAVNNTNERSRATRIGRIIGFTRLPRSLGRVSRL